ncbi:MAG TPA: aldo/keto reductase [Bacillota bacterium]|nr:aldo/keto reductase [Bacillota bacterium]
MQYRRFGKLDWQPSALGFGCMRLPTLEGRPMSENIDEQQAVAMIRHAIDQGVNYVDTAYPYHGGKSETVVGQALKDGYRQKVKLATKSPVWFIQKPEDFNKYLNEQLEKLQTDYIDFYLLHALDREKWENIILKHNVLAQAEAAVRDGRIKHIGFSFHDDYAAFQQIVDGYEGWDFCQIQYNYMDTENQAGTKGLKYAAAKGLGVIIMEPLLGGKLANPPAPLQGLFDQAPAERTPADWALQWLWNQPEVSLVLSGMSTLEQVNSNISSADQSGVGALTPQDLAFIEAVQQKYRERTAIPCTKCSYCMPCPNGVDIPKNFEIYNDGFMHQDEASARWTYSRFIGESERAGCCVGCKVCEEQCPQKIAISDLLPQVHQVLGEGKSYLSK